jgi:mRNA interferase MazF
MQKGDIVLIVFPFSDLSGSKLRPALVLATSSTELTVLFITTQLKWKELTDVTLVPDKFNGIKKPSLLRIFKLATLDRRLVKGRLGYVSSMVQTEVDSKMKIYLQLA